MLIRVSALADLADQLNGIDDPFAEGWDVTGECFRAWAGQPDLRANLRTHVAGLSTHEAEALIDRSRETTTHFAWCLRARPEEPYSFWLHEYKPQRDWRHGYADSVHNHRYHFCTVLVSGGYLHERYRAEIDPTTGLISSVALIRSQTCAEGDSERLLCTDFHRIPLAEDRTTTFLVKSSPLTISSLSFDPATRTGHLHLPVESRLANLADRI